MGRHWQLKVQVDVLHEKVNGQVPQSMSQLFRSAAQFRAHGQAFGHQVVLPSHVTWPRSPELQLLSTPVQVLLPLQATVLPSQQFAVAVQSDFGPMAGFAH